MMRYGSDPRPPPYHSSSSEADPLLSRRPSRQHQTLNICIYTTLIAVLAGGFAIAIFASAVSLSPCNNPLDPDVRDRIRKQWNIELRHHQQQVLKHVATEKRWRLEDDDRNRLREQWGREVAEHDQQVEERRRREEEERLRLNMFWTDAEPHMCTTYGTREYTARLVNVPSYYNRRVEACMATAIQIHGVNYTPKWCEDHGSNNVVGHWEVDQQQPDCVPHWDWYKDFGCVSPGSGQRRIEQHLKNIPEGADWREFCATTPASFNGVHFIGAQSCLLDPNNGGTWGYWDIDDERCNK